MIPFLQLQKKKKKKITKLQMSDAQIENYKLAWVFSPNPLRKLIFTAVANNNIEFNTPHQPHLKIFKEQV